MGGTIDTVFTAGTILSCPAEGEPQSSVVPYQTVIFSLEKKEETYIVTGIMYFARGKEKQARFSDFTEIAPGRYRPQRMIVVGEGGRTEFAFSHWTLGNPEPQFFTPAQLETKTLALPKYEKRE